MKAAPDGKAVPWYEKGSFPEPQGNLTGGQMSSQGPSVRD